MYDYMQALQEKFFSDDVYTERRQEIETIRCKLSHTLDKQRRKQLLQLVDAESQLRDDMALASFIAGLRNQQRTRKRQLVFLRKRRGAAAP